MATTITITTKNQLLVTRTGLSEAMQNGASQGNVLACNSLPDAIRALQNTNLLLTLGEKPFTIEARDGGRYDVAFEGKFNAPRVIEISEGKYSLLVRLKNVIKKIFSRSPVKPPAEKLRQTLGSVQKENGTALLIISMVKDTTVKPKELLSSLTNDGKSQAEGFKLINYLKSNPDSKLFSSKNITVDVENHTLKFTEPLIVPATEEEEELVFERLVIDYRDRSNHEFRGEFAQDVFRNLTFTSLQDLCNKLSQNERYNYEKQRSAVFIAKELNSPSTGWLRYEKIREACPGIDTFVSFDPETREFTSKFSEIRVQREVDAVLDDSSSNMSKPDSLLSISDSDHRRMLHRSASYPSGLNENNQAAQRTLSRFAALRDLHINTYSDSKPSSTDDSGYESEDTTVGKNQSEQNDLYDKDWQGVESTLKQTDMLLNEMIKKKNLLITDN